MNALSMLLGGPQRIGLDGIIDSRVLCCMRFSDTRVLTGVSGTFLNGETITVRRSGEVVATATIDAVLSSTKLALHGISATINTGDAISGNTSAATATAFTGAVELVDVGPGKYAVTNSGMTAGAVGTGPFVGDRAINDPTLADYAYAGNAAFQAARSFFCRVKPEFIPVGGLNEVFMRFSSGVDAQGPTIELAVYPFDASRVRILALLRTTSNSTPIEYSYTPPIAPGVWYGIYVNFNTTPKAYINGIRFFSGALSRPSFGATPVFCVGRYRTSTTTYAAAGNDLADLTLFNQDVGIDGGFMPSARYRYPQI